MMDIASTIGAAAVVTQQTSPQINPQQDQANATGVAAGNNHSAQQQIISETRNTAQGTSQNSTNGENAASNDDAKGSDNDKDNAASQSLSGVGANLDITA